MSLALVATLVVLGFVSAFASGLLGIGGALVLIPLLLYIPPWLGLAQFSAQAVSGMAMAQVLVGSASGLVGHRRTGHLDKRLGVVMGLSVVVSSFAGATLSAHLPEKAILGTFSVVALLAAALLFLPREDHDSTTPPNRLLAGLIAFAIGLPAGVVGVGGAVFLIPAMLLVLKLPLRVTLATSLAVVFMSSVAGTLGKALTHQLPLEPAIMLALGASLGGYLGSHVSRHTSPRVLRNLLAGLIVAVAVRMFVEVVFGH